MKRFLALALSFAFAAAAMAEEPYRELAEKLSAPASRKLRTVAVLPFGCAESTGTSRDGKVLRERLAAELINLGRFSVLDPGRYAGTLRELSFDPDAGASPELALALREKFAADAFITGMSAELADGRAELTARLVRTSDQAAVVAVRAALPRDWAPPPETHDPRAVLRALAKRRVRAASVPEWAEFGKARAASLQERLSIAALGGSEKLADAEIEEWKASPSEAVSRVFFPCASASCDARGITGEGYFKAYFPDGFVLLLDEAGDVLDGYYPARSLARLRMRLLARRSPGQNLAGGGAWARFQETMDQKYVPVADKRDPDSLRSEIDLWKASPAEQVTGIYSPETGDHPDFYKVMFSDGFTLLFDGPSGAIERCEYAEPEKGAARPADSRGR